MSDVTLPVTGMTCAACARTIERTLQKVPGVQDASVNLVTNRATVRFDPSRADVSNLKKAVRDVGYGVLELVRRRCRHSRIFRKKRTKLNTVTFDGS